MSRAATTFTFAQAIIFIAPSAIDSTCPATAAPWAAASAAPWLAPPPPRLSDRIQAELFGVLDTPTIEYGEQASFSTGWYAADHTEPDLTSRR